MRILGDRVWIRPVEPAVDTPSGLVLVRSEPPCRGTVVAIGDGVRCVECHARRQHGFGVGDMVFFSPFAPGQEFHVNGETLLVLKEGEVLAVLE